LGRALACPWEALCLAVFLGLTGWQLFFHPVTGLSDNNDFAKVLGPAHVCKGPFDDLNAYFVTGYAAGPKCIWPSGFISSEVVFVDLARYLSRPFTGRYYFDIRASAAVHLLVLAAAMALLLSVTRRQGPWVRFVVPPLAIFMFTDVAYVAYLNSAYMDNASWVLLLLLTSIAAMGSVRRQGWIATAYAIAGVLLVFSKAQHAVLGIPFAGLAAWFAYRHREQRVAWCIGGFALLVSAAVMPALTPAEYRTISLYNLVFDRLAPADRNVLGELGLDASYQRWIGSEVFAPDSPLHDPDWTDAFLRHVTWGSVARLYVSHPGLAMGQIDRELHDSVHSMRPSYMANYRQADGFPPHTAATRFSLWSSIKMRFLAAFPYSLLVLYALPLVAGRPLGLTLAVAGIAEFVLCTLADAIDTHRHLFLFHVITDALILWLVGNTDSLKAVTQDTTGVGVVSRLGFAPVFAMRRRLNRLRRHLRSRIRSR
jgi:hypothetical protein